MVLREVLPSGPSCRGAFEEHRHGFAAAFRAVLSKRKIASVPEVRRSSSGQARAKAGLIRELQTKMPVTDIHAHFFPESWPDLAARFGTPDWPCIEHTEPGNAVIKVGEREFRRITSACWDVNVRLEQMDRDGVDHQIISATPVLFAYNREPLCALECARLFNDAALEMCNQGKERLQSLCQVPLQDIDASCAELTRCMRAGHVDVEIGNHVGDKNLDDPGIVTFLHHCADEGAAVLVNPWDMMASQRMPKYMM